MCFFIVYHFLTQDEQKSSNIAQPYAQARKLCHLKAAPQNSTDCYVSMQTPEESSKEPNNTTEKELEVVADETIDGGNEYMTTCPQVKINNGRKDFESSLEFGGSLETSLEFGGTRETSLDFVGPSQVFRRARSTSPRPTYSETIKEEDRLSMACKRWETQEKGEY